MNPAFKLLGALLFGTVLLAVPAGGTRAQDKGPAAGPTYTKVASIEGITEYRFPNGLRFLSFPDPSSSNVTVNMTVLVGSRHEGYGETGMAHLLEHMLFKGSKKFPNVDKSMQAHGADFNGTTWTDRTNYYETMPATEKNLEFGIQLEADRLVNSFIKREDLAKEMTVVRNEFEMGENTPEYILNQRMMAVAFEWHNYGKSTIGNRTDIERVPIENLQAFYRKYYQPDNVVLTVAGKFDEKKALALVSKYFGALKAPDRKLTATYTEEPAQDGERMVTLRRVGKVAVVGAMYHIPAAAHEDSAAIEVLASILGNTPSGRLYKALVESKKATKVAGESTSWHDPGVLELTAFVNDKASPIEVRDLLTETVEKLATRPATDKEVKRAIALYMSARDQAMTNSKRVCLELSEWIGAGDWRLLFVTRDRVAKVTPADVNRVAAKYLRRSNRTVGIFIPSAKVARVSIPDTPTVTKIVNAYKGGEALTGGEAFDPTPENIEKAVIRKTLSNGIKVVFLPKKTRGQAVVGSITLHFGNEKSLFDHTTSSSFLGALMMRGTKRLTRADIQDELAILRSSLTASSSLGQLTFGLRSKRGQLPGLLKLFKEVLREPTFPPSEMSLLKQNQRQTLEKALNDPQRLAFHTLMRTLRPYPKTNIRYQPTIEESIQRVDKVTRDDVERLYEGQIGGDHGEIALIGDLDVEATTRQLEEIFAGWKAKVPYERIRSEISAGVKGSRTTINTPDKENAVYAAGLMFAMKDSDPDYPALSMGNYVLGGSGFTSRLMDRLRQKEGLSYGAGSFLRVGSEDRVGAFVAYAIANPKNIEKVDTGAVEEIAKILKTGVTQEELAAAKKGYLEELKTERGSDSSLASMLRQNLRLGRTFQYYADLERKIAELKTADVSRALDQHLSIDRLVIIRAGDFTKKSKSAPMK